MKRKKHESQAFGQRLQKCIHDHGFTLTQFAKLTNIHKVRLNHHLEGETSPYMDPLKRILSVLLPTAKEAEELKNLYLVGQTLKYLTREVEDVFAPYLEGKTTEGKTTTGGQLLPLLFDALPASMHGIEKMLNKARTQSLNRRYATFLNTHLQIKSGLKEHVEMVQKILEYMESF
jgi:transcriptional regulator with XRE-family HTH domain